MENNQLKPVDPMFTLHRGGAQVPAYQRRPAGLKFEDIALLKQSSEASNAPAPVRQTPQPQEVAREPNIARHTTSAATHHRRKAYAVPRTASTPQVEPMGSGKKRRHLKLLIKQTWVLYGMAVTVFVVGLSVSLAGLRTNHDVAKQVKQVQKKASATESDPAVPSTTKPSTQEVAHYTVSPNIPRYIDIPKLNTHARVLSQGVSKNGQLQVPWNIYDTGWYNASSQPGQNGAMLIDGHSGIGGMKGVFYDLGTLKAGDPITVTRGDGQKFTYAVVTVQTVNVKDANMAGMLVSADTARPGLNLITCAGDRIPGTAELDKRIEVFAVLQ